MNQNFPLNDATFDVISMLYQKSKALEAYSKYEQDAQANSELKSLLSEIRQQDEQQIQRLKQCLTKMLQKGS